MVIVPVLLMFFLAAPFNDPVGAALERYRDVSSYRVTLHSMASGRQEVIRYHYKRPGFIRMEFVTPHRGALLVYDPVEKTVRLRPFGFASLFVLTLSPDNSLVKSAQGHRVDESDMGALLQRVKRLKERGTATILKEERLGAKDTVVVAVEGKEGISLEGVHRYLLWFDKLTQLPLKSATYDSRGKQLEEVLMDDLEVNVEMADSLFVL